MKTDTAAKVRPIASGIAFRQIDALLALTVIALVIGCFLRMTRGETPLWFDETFTGAIAAEPDWGSVFYQVLQELNAPLYYLVAHASSLAFGLSNQSLRFPALIFALLAPFLCLIPTPGIPQRVSWLWCALTVLWVQAFFMAQEARCYSLLFCLSLAATIAYVRLLENPDIKRAALWALVASGAILTHYDAVILIAFQGVFYLAWCGRKAWRTWPAAFVFAPLCLWMVIHLSRILELSGAMVAWYPLVTGNTIILLLNFIVGSRVTCFLLMLFVAIAAFFIILRRRPPRKEMHDQTAVAVALVTMASAICLVVLGVFRPIFLERYITPFVPGLFLGLALMTERLRAYWSAASITLICFFMISAYFSTFIGTPERYQYNFEAASQALLQANTSRLVFFWDHPANSAENPLQLEAVGRFFFQRDGVNVKVVPFKPTPGEDPNRALLEAARATDSDGLLWIYDTKSNTGAKQFPPSISSLDSQWSCRNFAESPIGILACHKGQI